MNTFTLGQMEFNLDLAKPLVSDYCNIWNYSKNLNWSMMDCFLGPEEGKWYLDLKTGTGCVGKGDAPNSADATLTMHCKDFADMFAGMLQNSAIFIRTEYSQKQFFRKTETSWCFHDWKTEDFRQFAGGNEAGETDGPS